MAGGTRFFFFYLVILSEVIPSEGAYPRRRTPDLLILKLKHQEFSGGSLVIPSRLGEGPVSCFVILSLGRRTQRICTT